jgi:hypothetical protein
LYRVFHSFQRTSTGKAPIDLFQSPEKQTT